MKSSIKKFLAAAFTVIMVIAMMVPMALAMEASHEIITTDNGDTPPFSVSPNDSIQYEISANFPAAIEKPDEIDIDIDPSMRFIDIDEITAHDNTGKEIPWNACEDITKENDTVKVMLNTVPENAENITLTYTCSATDILSVGTAGMYNTARIITHANGVRQNESTSLEVRSRRVYTWYMELWTIDNGKSRQVTTTSTGSTNDGNSSGKDMHPGQSVEGAVFKIFTDENLINELSFAESFRRYTVCSEANAKHVNEIRLDNSGRAAIIGLKAGTYWVQECKAPYGYEKALSQPIKVEFDYDTDELPGVKMINLYDQNTYENWRVETRRGPSIIIDYDDKLPNINIQYAVIAGIVMILAVSAGITVYINAKTKNNANKT